MVFRYNNVNDLMLRNIINQLLRMFVFTAMKVILWFGDRRDTSCSGKIVVREVSQVTSRYVTLHIATHLIRQKSPWF